MGGVLRGGNPVRMDWFGLAGLAGLVIIVSFSRSRRVRLDHQLLSYGIILFPASGVSGFSGVIMGLLHCLRSERHRGFLEHSPVDGTINLHGIFSQPWRWGASLHGCERFGVFVLFFRLLYLSRLLTRFTNITASPFLWYYPQLREKSLVGHPTRKRFLAASSPCCARSQTTTFLATSSICTLYPIAKRTYTTF